MTAHFIGCLSLKILNYWRMINYIESGGKKVSAPYILRWNIYVGGRRKGANITVKEPSGERNISGTVIGWLDAELAPCARKTAGHCLVRRWSYGSDTLEIPEEFAVPLDKPPSYHSKTFRPWPTQEAGENHD